MKITILIPKNNSVKLDLNYQIIKWCGFLLVHHLECIPEDISFCPRQCWNIWISISIIVRFLPRAVLKVSLIYARNEKLKVPNDISVPKNCWQTKDMNTNIHYYLVNTYLRYFFLPNDNLGITISKILYKVLICSVLLKNKLSMSMQMATWQFLLCSWKLL